MGDILDEAALGKLELDLRPMNGCDEFDRAFEAIRSLRARLEKAEAELCEIALHLNAECDSDSILHEIREAQADRDIFKEDASTARNDALEEAAAYCERTAMGTPYNNTKAVYGGYVPGEILDGFGGTHQGQGYAAALRALKSPS